jgi:hypothetical protein
MIVRYYRDGRSATESSLFLLDAAGHEARHPPRRPLPMRLSWRFIGYSALSDLLDAMETRWIAAALPQTVTAGLFAPPARSWTSS